MLTEARSAHIGVRNIRSLLSVIVVAGGSVFRQRKPGYEDLLTSVGDVHEPADIPNDSPALIKALGQSPAWRR